MAINPDAVYYNYQGKLPPITLETSPVEPPRGFDDTRLITDTTLRDGAQDSRFALFPVETRLAYVDLLHRLDNGTGRINRLETFIYQDRDQWALHKLLDRGYEFPEITTWTRAQPKDIKLLVDVAKGRIKETGMLASASDHHIFDKLRFASKQEAADKYLQPVHTAWPGLPSSPVTPATNESLPLAVRTATVPLFVVHSVMSGRRVRRSCEPC